MQCTNFERWGLFLTEGEIGAFVLYLLYLTESWSVCACVCGYTHTQPHTARGVLGCELMFRDETSEGPEESRLTKALHTCMLYMCTKYVHILYVRQRNDVWNNCYVSFDIYFLPRKENTDMKVTFRPQIQLDLNKRPNLATSRDKTTFLK